MLTSSGWHGSHVVLEERRMALLLNGLHTQISKQSACKSKQSSRRYP